MTERGLCMCGCGQPAPIASRSNPSRGDVVGEPTKYVRHHQPRPSRDRHHAWKGGRYVSQGYVMVRRPDHPRAIAGGYVMEHVLIVESVLGRFLPESHPVHHVDENRSNNANGNLVVCENKAYHNLLHRRLRALRAFGDPNAVECFRCGHAGDFRSMVMRPKGHTTLYRHDVCPREREDRGGPIEESPSYREALRDAGRGY